MMRTTLICVCAAIAVLWGCGGQDAQESPAQTGSTTMTLPGGTKVPQTFSEDVAFLKAHTKVIELGGGNGPGIIVAPDYQGRVMTSTFDSKTGTGIGFIKYDVVANGVFTKGMTAFGGEDRIWLGPEGGQFSIFFKQGAEQNGDNWQTPAFIDSDKYDVVSQSPTDAVFKKVASVTNASGTKFNFEIDRTVALLDNDAVSKDLGVDVPSGVKAVAYESRNTLKNTGDNAWTKDGGLLSIWILSMYKHSKTTRVVVPYNTDAQGRIVKDDYFGKVPADRLVDKHGYLVFKCDGQMRTKIGVSPERAKDVLGSWDPARSLLTIVQYNKPKGVTDYVNSQWTDKPQDDPFGGDVINSYNDGPFAKDKPPMGPFYEVESSSPALALKPGGSYTHIHRTFHFTGPKDALQKIATAVLGVDLDDVATALPN
ncbi:MAG TPA: DUF6786 family protein [Fimbriimonadaceae bacterium]|nr:DUF6786 family protein [Fimbriimonadaceae bacterium]